jgi:two-component system KDP operon response regulator KdpE
MVQSDARNSVHRTVLIVDDEPHLIHAIRLYLDMEGYSVTSATNGEEAVEATRTSLPDAILLDVMLPGEDGFEVLRRLRAISLVPIIMLTARDSESDKVRGLQLGADDYITKPFSQAELLSRIQAVIRRASAPALAPKTELVIDERLQIDFSRREVRVEGELIALRPTEYRLLYHFVSNPGRVLTYETLLAKVWGEEYRDEDQYVRLYVTYLRQKIEPNPTHPRYILTERGVGYRFVDYRKERPGGPLQV